MPDTPLAAPIRHLVIVLGDQLDHNATALQGFDPELDVVWMAEVAEESTHVWSSKQRIAIFLSSMRHFAAEVRERGLPLRYTRLDDAGNTGSLAGELQRVDLDELRLAMQGSQLLLWRMPPGYREPIRPEASSPVVPWLEARLAQLQGRAAALQPGQHYDEPLQLQVLAFQHHYQLVTDAVIGPQTLIQLSALTEPDVPLLSTAEAGWE